MESKEEIWRQFVEAYEIEVPEEKVEEELRYILLEMRHRLQYDTLINHAVHLNPRAEIASREEEYRRLARYEAKSELVMKELLAKWNPSVTKDELLQEARAVAVRQNADADLVKAFFGEDLAMLERDLKERKIKARICRKQEE